jgi:hypothetical protein
MSKERLRNSRLQHNERTGHERTMYAGARTQADFAAVSAQESRACSSLVVLSSSTAQTVVCRLDQSEPRAQDTMYATRSSPPGGHNRPPGIRTTVRRAASFPIAQDEDWGGAPMTPCAGMSGGADDTRAHVSAPPTAFLDLDTSALYVRRGARWASKRGGGARVATRPLPSSSFYGGAGERVPGLAGVFHAATLGHMLLSAAAWCEEHGAAYLEECLEDHASLCAHIGLLEEDARHPALLEELRAAALSHCRLRHW